MVNPTVEVDVDLVHETNDAYCVKQGEDTFAGVAKSFWIPKSQSSLEGSTLTVSEWLANDKGLI